MHKVIGYQAIVKVNGFHDAKTWIYRMIRAGVVKCGQCDRPATNVFWQDRAEWYCRCEGHREYGEMWTGSTRWNPSSFGINVLNDAAEAWLKTLEEHESRRVRIRSFDATDYYELMVEDWDARTDHYFRGGAKEWGWRTYARITPLTNGEFVYELHHDYTHEHGGHMQAYGVRGAWGSVELALEAATTEARKRNLLPVDEESSS